MEGPNEALPTNDGAELGLMSPHANEHTAGARFSSIAGNFFASSSLDRNMSFGLNLCFF